MKRCLLRVHRSPRSPAATPESEQLGSALLRLESYKYFMNLKAVLNQDKHNQDPEKLSGLSEFESLNEQNFISIDLSNPIRVLKCFTKKGEIKYYIIILY